MTVRYPLTSLINNVVDNRGRSAPLAEQGIALIATNCIKPDAIYPVFEKVRYVSIETYETWFRGHPRPGDIIIVNKGTPGLTAIVPDPIDFAIAQDMVAIRADEAKIYPKYLFAYMRSREFAEQVLSLHVGTLIPHLKKSHFNLLTIPVPSRAVQETVGDMFFSLSVKIELNRRMNATLEEMARALFRSWFVDFDPVKVKARGGDPSAELGLAPEIAALFPDSFQDSLLGPIPAGWSLRPLDTLGTFLNGLALQKFAPRPGEPTIPAIKIAELRRGVTDASDRVSANLPEQYVVNDGDLLFSWSGSLTALIWTGGRGALNQHLFKVTSDEFEQWLVLGWIEHHLPEFQDIAANKATTMGHIQRGHLNQALCAVPPNAHLYRLGLIAGPIHATRIQNEVEDKSLAETRDYLLPRLLGGALDINKRMEALIG